ncbi:SpoIIE family protein phosphatase [Amycolatopsis thermophila]|uniref:Sigma-B regulation protein RsbU (Phosphoserine phosphatase) n=1 Tax=Amycolatopsis thermophila TaxID=206084 RepID=A0ABU0EYZ7_9PSEU|nr:SpoIIE family protein phosphatase [Amycolatopsis thermophila]MDQ0380540.1 sigma-B regulation protein RsbU (phosphoserine phosphatase) [Amycolatopsis thermophila]
MIEGGSPVLAWDSAEDLWDNAPCGYLVAKPDGTILRVNKTLLNWLGYPAGELVGRRFSDLLTAGGRLYHETHYAPLLRMQSEVREIALELVTADGGRLPVLVNSTLRTGPDGRPGIRTSVFDARARRSYERELLRARREAERERERLARLSQTLQETLLPPGLPEVPGLRAAAYYHTAAAEQLGGDFYDLFPVSGNRWAFFIGDVCGKGAEAAVLTSLARYTLRAAAVQESDPRSVLATLNAVLLQSYRAREGRFCTVLFGLIEPDGDGFRVDLAGGGHPPALRVATDGRVRRLDTPGGQLCGVIPDAAFTAVATRLEPGQVLFLYTDGLFEARDAQGALVGEERLARAAAGFAGLDADAVAGRVARLVADLEEGVSDDTAALVLTVPA